MDQGYNETESLRLEAELLKALGVTPRSYRLYRILKRLVGRRLAAWLADRL